MADAKRYYWLKLNENFFDREEIKVIESMPNGKDYIIFYMKLLLKSIRTEGQLRFRGVIPYTPDMLAAITNTSVDTVRVAIDMFSKLDLMEVWDDGTLFMIETQNMIGSETDSARRMRIKRQRDNQKKLQSSHCDADVQKSDTDIEIELDIDKELDKDIEEDEEERVLSLENSDKVPSLCQEEDDPVLEFLNQVSSYYTSLTGRLANANDEVAITDIAKHTTNFEIVKEAMDMTLKNYKPRYKGDKIRTFKYFVPGIMEWLAVEEEKRKRKEVKVADGSIKGNNGRGTREAEDPYADIGITL